MARKPKASPDKGKTRKPKENEKAQSARFIETARTIGVDESGKEFERALKKIASRRPGPSD